MLFEGQNRFSSSTSSFSPYAGHFQKQILFELSDVSVTFDTIDALKNICFRVEKEEVIFLTGASGAGKTTLLKLLGEDILPTRGELRKNETKQKKLFVAKVFQDLRLFYEMTGLENIELVYEASQFKSKKDFKAEIFELAKILGISDRLDLKVKCANGGLKQKIAIIRALMTRPDVLIADEPTSALDYKNASKLFELLSLYNKKMGLTIVWATHNRELVQRFIGRIVHLDNGKIIHSGHACFI